MKNKAGNEIETQDGGSMERTGFREGRGGKEEKGSLLGFFLMWNGPTSNP